MTAPNVLQLREAPVEGRFYMAPCIFGKYVSARDDWWPVLLPAHSDGEFFKGFPWHHYHIDHRFLTRRQLARLESKYRTARQWTGGSPIIVKGPNLPEVTDAYWSINSQQKPSLRRRKCTTADPGYPHRGQSEIQRLRDTFLEGLGGARCIRTRSGRALCPHQRVDLSSYPVADDGTVICPAHGLKVQVAA